MASDTRAPAKREKVALKKGFHLMDWMRLVQSSFDLSGRKGSGPLRVTTKELRLHNKETDCWTVYNGKVYNVTPYLPYHPGGVSILMEGAGKDSTRLFNKYHAWVNCESIIGKCCVGVFVGNSKDELVEDAEEIEPQVPAPKATVETKEEIKLVSESGKQQEPVNVFTRAVATAVATSSSAGKDAIVAVSESVDKLSMQKVQEESTPAAAAEGTTEVTSASTDANTKNTREDNTGSTRCQTS